MVINIAAKAFHALLITSDKGGENGYILTFIGIFRLACKLFRLSWGQGEVYRERYKRYGNKEDLKRTKEADSAIMFSIVVFTFVLCMVFH